MAETMRERQAFGGSCTYAQLTADGFTMAEAFAYGDDARKILSGRPGAGEIRLPPGRAEGLVLSDEARRLAERKAVSAPAPAPAPSEPAIREGEARPYPATRPAPDLHAEIRRRFGSLGPAILDDLGAAGLAIAPAAEIEETRRERDELRDAIEDVFPLVDSFVRRISRVPTPGWERFRGELAQMIGGGA